MLEGIVSKRNRLPLRERSDQGMAEDEEPELSTQLTGNISNAELDRLIAGFRSIPSRKGSCEKSKKASMSPLSQLQPEGFEYAFCLNSGGRSYFLFRKAAASTEHHPVRGALSGEKSVFLLGQETEQFSSLSVGNSRNSEQLSKSLDVFLGDINWYVLRIICHGEAISVRPTQRN